MSRRDQLAGFHQTISEQLNARLEESPRFFWALVTISTGYGYVLWSVATAPDTAKPDRHAVATLASILAYLAVLWASWYLAALGYAFRFLQNSQHCIERALGWYDYAPEPREPRGIFGLLPSIYQAHAFGLCAFLLVLCASFCWLWQWHLCAVLDFSLFSASTRITFENSERDVGRQSTWLPYWTRYDSPGACTRGFCGCGFRPSS